MTVDKYGVTFELPKTWTSVSAKEMADLISANKNEDLDKLTSRMGVSPQQFQQFIAANVQTFSVSTDGAVDGFVANVNSLGLPAAQVSVDKLKLGLAAQGARVLKVDHPANDDVEALHSLLVPAPSKLLELHRVGDAVSNVRNDGPELHNSL